MFGTKKTWVTFYENLRGKNWLKIHLRRLSCICYFEVSVHSLENRIWLWFPPGLVKDSLQSRCHPERRGLLHGTGLSVPTLDGIAGAFWDRLKLEQAAPAALCYHNDLTCSWKWQGKRPVHMHQTNTNNLRHRTEKGKVGERKNDLRREDNYEEDKLREKMRQEETREWERTEKDTISFKLHWSLLIFNERQLYTNWTFFFLVWKASHLFSISVL